MPNRKFHRKSQAQMKQQLAKAQQNVKKTPIILKREQPKPQVPQAVEPLPLPQPEQPQQQQTLQQPPQQTLQQPGENANMPAGEQPPQEQASTQTEPASYQANRDWRVLRNHLNPEGTTIEMVYTGEECLPPDEPEPEPEEDQQQEEEQQPGEDPPQPQPQAQPQRQWPRVEARPGVTHASVHLPQGVLPSTNSLPDMPGLINAIDFFAHPERHQPDPNAGPRTTVTVTPKAAPKAANTIEVVPLGSYEALPLEPGTLNMAFQSFSTMDFTLEPAPEGADPNCTYYSAEMSPSIMLTQSQQHRLQAAVLQQEIPLAEAVLPVVQDMRKEYNQMLEMGQQPPTQPIPHTTMQFYSKNTYTSMSPSPAPSALSSSPPESQFEGGASFGYGGYGSEPGSVSGSQTGPGPRLVLLPTPQVAPIPPNYGQPMPQPNFAQPMPGPNFAQPMPPPNYGQPMQPPPNFGQPMQPPTYYGQPSMQPPTYGQPMPPPPPRYPVYVQPNFVPNYGQVPPPPRYPVYMQQPPFVPNSIGQQPPRYPVPVYPNYVPNYGQQGGPPRYPVIMQPGYMPTYGPVPPPQVNGGPSGYRM